MRNAARISLAVVVLLAGALLLPRPAGRVLAPDAGAQVPTPTIPDLLPSSSPSPSPTEPGGGGGGGGGDDDGGGGEGDGGSGGGGGVDKPGAGGGDKKDGPNVKKGTSADKKKRSRKARKKVSIFTDVPSIPGSFNTDDLVVVAAHLRSLGWSQQQVIAKVYPPFIIAGPAVWTDTWGAPRYGPGPIVRTHEGQDVFCEYGDPVLATEDGTVSFDDQGLGGLVARLHRSDGSYWYYAHLSDWNHDLRPGDSVQRGDVLGYCGNSGNALTTPPHVHFGWYLRNENAKNPMRSLVDWLREARRGALGLLADARGKRVREIVRLTAERRFGDAFVPDRTMLRVPGEALWASGSSPATGAFGLAEAALQSALSRQLFSLESSITGLELRSSEAGAGTVLDPDSDLAAILRDAELLSEVAD
jgi:murein DD-endopeptidase MepM/ murein hydrolase activator NlpD